ncbi:MAG: DUF1549 and DUF1553 domain-containing protein [Planctomycetaceae bacterium]
MYFKRLTFALGLLGGLVLAGLRAGALADDAPSAGDRSHWAFQPVVAPAVPLVGHADLVRNPIDAFLLEKLEQAGLSYAREADRRSLIRRLTLDLTGLPPTPEEIHGFLADASGDAYERLVDRLLDSPHYGEHWGRMWLDVVRFAETAGYNADPVRPNAWKYRDYVIRAFNEDRPFDRFVQEQIAGDELFTDDPQGVLGSGYVLLWPDESNASNILLARQEALNELTGNVGSVFLGLSVGCAQCHNHKFDPISQKDFYRLQAFFSGLVRCDEAPLGSSADLLAYRQALDSWLVETEPLRNELHRLEYDARVKASGDRRMKFPQMVLDALDTPPEARTALQRQWAFWAERQIEIKEENVSQNLSEEQRQRRTELKAELAEWRNRKPQPPAEIAGMIAGEITAEPPATYLLAGGSYNKQREEVLPGFLSVLSTSPSTDADVAAPHPRTSGRRSALAGWLTDPANPLVSRVLVNRIWQGHFGVGLVENSNDFGLQTRPPSHPKLLDWLAAAFLSPETSPAASCREKPREGAWSVKKIHRLIVTSTAYRQSALFDAGEPSSAGESSDPANHLYWHFPRRRLGAEALRDALLAVSGLLNPAVHGPSVYPEIPADYSKRHAWPVSKEPADRCRRSVYIHVKRNLPYPLLEAFDAPDLHESCACRVQTTVAPQALFLLNSDLVLDYARAFAGRLLQDNPDADVDRAITRAYRLAFGREPGSKERADAREFLGAQTALAADRLAAGKSVPLPRSLPPCVGFSQAAALVDFCHALFNASEFLYVD